jgi:DNA primase
VDDPKAPKYLNSPETVLYSKTKTLYGLDKAKQAIRTADYAILVEGQMDLIMSHQSGLKNTVAVSGTALSDDLEKQGDMTGLGLISRLSKNVVVAFDSDSAGVKAALRAARIGLSLGLDIKIAYPEGGKDPADIIKEDPKAWATSIKNAKNVVEFALDRIMDRKLDQKHIGVAVKDEVLHLIALTTSAIEQSRLIEITSLKSGIKSDALWKDLARVKPEEVFSTQKIGSGESVSLKKENNSLSKLERLLNASFGIMFAEDSSGKEFGKSLYEASGQEIYNSFINLPKTDISALATESEIMYGERGPDKKLLEELLTGISKERLKIRRDEIKRELEIYEKEGKNSDALLKEYVELSKKISG